MAILQLFIIMNLIIGFLRVNCRLYLLDIFDTGADQTRPTQDGEFFDTTRFNPTQPDPRMDPCPTLIRIVVHFILLTVCFFNFTVRDFVL